MTLTEFIAEAKRLVLDAFAEDEVDCVTCEVTHRSNRKFGDSAEFQVFLHRPGREVEMFCSPTPQGCLELLQQYLRPATPVQEVVDALGAIPTV